FAPCEVVLTPIYSLGKALTSNKTVLLEETEKDPFNILDLMTTHVKPFKAVRSSSSTTPPNLDALKLVNEFRQFIYSAPLEVTIDTPKKGRELQEILDKLQAISSEHLPLGFEEEFMVVTNMFNGI
ncbi:unnamed protein product, partial [Sphenostylis stenocarpa]